MVIGLDNELLQIVSEASKGDVSAFAKLYETVYRDMYYCALAKLGNPDDAADAVSDAVLDAYTGIKKLKNPECFRVWIFKILIRQINKRYKEYSDFRGNRTDIGDEEGLTEQTSPDLSLVEVLESFGRLTKPEREVVSLSVISGLSGEEISQITGINPSTVRSHLSRAKAKLREEYL